MGIRLPNDDCDFAIYSIHKNELRHGFEYEFDPAPGTEVPQYVESESEGFWDFELDRRVYPSTRDTKKPWKKLPPFYQVGCDYTNQRPAFEIKSAVAPLSIHKLIIKQHLIPNCIFNKNKNGPDNGGGIHVSTSTTRKTEDLHKKVFSFLHYDDFRKFMKIGQRDVSQYHWCRQNGSWEEEDSDGGLNDDHCSIINTADGDRYELRMYAAHPDLLLPALETADSLFSLATEVDEITFENWGNFVSGKLKYRELKEHLHATFN